MSGRRWAAAALLAGGLACAEWAGPALGGPRLVIVPVVRAPDPAGPAAAAATVLLLNDLDRVRVTAVRLPARAIVVDTTVAADPAGNATVSIPFFFAGAAEQIEVGVQGIRSSDGAVLYVGSDTIVVRAGLPTPPDSVPIAYVGPCGVRAGCAVTLGPQNAALKQGGALAIAVTVDSAGVPVGGVPVRLANVTPALLSLGAGPAVTALSGTSCGPARIAAAIAGATDTLRLQVLAPVTQAPVLFAGDSSGVSSGVFCQNTDGTGRFAVSRNGAAGDVNPRYSPDRQRVAFTFRPVSPAGASPNLLYVARWAGDSEVAAVFDTSATRPRWSPNGAHLAFGCGDGVSPDQDVCVLLDVTGALSALPNAVRVFVTDAVASRPDGPAAFAWDPLNPDRLAFVRDSVTADRKTTSALYVGNFDGTGVVRLTPAPLDAGTGVLRISELDWSPRGDVIVFAAADTLFQEKLYAVNRDGTGFRRLTAGPDFDSRPVVSPDGTQVLFTRRLAGQCALDYWRVGIDGTGVQRLSNEAGCAATTAGLGYDWSPDGRQVVLVGILDRRIYVVPAGTTAATYLADRVLIGRAPDATGVVTDLQPSWRP